MWEVEGEVGYTIEIYGLKSRVRHGNGRRRARGDGLATDCFHCVPSANTCFFWLAAKCGSTMPLQTGFGMGSGCILTIRQGLT